MTELKRLDPLSAGKIQTVFSLVNLVIHSLFQIAVLIPRFLSSGIGSQDIAYGIGSLIGFVLGLL